MNWLELAAAPAVTGIVTAPAFIAYHNPKRYAEMAGPIKIIALAVSLAILAFNAGYREGSDAVGNRLPEPVPVFFLVVGWFALFAYLDFACKWLTTLKGGVDKVSEERPDTDAD